MNWPRIVADELLTLDTPVPPGTRPLRTVSWNEWQRVADHAARPARSGASLPSFLLPHQRDSYQRTRAALDAWGGAVLAEPVGHGKTWIALAAAVVERSPAAVIVPAILGEQWHRAAATAGVAITISTHEALSRGRLPAGNPGFVIIDEAHHFRNPAIQRYRRLAPWLVGRRVLLLTGTPIVNRPGDLIALLHLFAPDDALCLDGISDWQNIAAEARPPTAFRRLIIRGDGARAGSTRRTSITPAGPECARAERAVASIMSLRLSTDDNIKRLIRTVLLDAAASSDVAWHDALGRYRALLLLAREAGGASRALLRRFAGPALDQLVLWPLLSPDHMAADLPEGDLPVVESLREVGAADGAWCAQLTTAIADDIVTVCFTRHRATARLLREMIGDGCAWVTGTDAGIGAHRITRNVVLNAFGPERRAWTARRTIPRILVATDVAAEGLDLQAAGRIVHIDLPWTAMRLDQREGRLLRLGQQHSDVAIIIREPAPAIAATLAPQARVRRKRVLADEWLATLTVPDNQDLPMPLDVAVFTGHDAGTSAALVVVALSADPHAGGIILASIDQASWSNDAANLTLLLQRAAIAQPGIFDPAMSEPILAAGVNAAIAHAARGSRGGDAALVRRVHDLARRAATARDGAALVRLDRLLRFVATAPTAGGRMLFDHLHRLDDRSFCRAIIPDFRPPLRPRAIPLALLLLNPGRR